MKKAIGVCLAALWVAAGFAGCTATQPAASASRSAQSAEQAQQPEEAQSASAQSAPAESASVQSVSTQSMEQLEEPIPTGIDYGPMADAEITVDREENGNRVQIPQLVWKEGSRPTGLELNEEILAFIGEPEQLLASEAGSCEVRAYHYVIGPSNINIIIVKDLNAKDGDVGEIQTYIYDYRFDEIYDEAEILEQSGANVRDVEKEMAAGDYLPEGERVARAELSGLVYGFLELDMLYTVTVQTADGGEENRLYVYRYQDILYRDDDSKWPRVMGAEQYFGEWVPMMS